MPSNVSPVGDDSLTLDMVGQMAYCPRRFHLMYVEGRWADNVYTVDGRHVHRRVDHLDHVLPDAEGSAGAGMAAQGTSAALSTGVGDEKCMSDAEPNTGRGVSAKKRQSNTSPPPGDDPPVISRSVPLASTRLDLTAKLDLVATVAGDSDGQDTGAAEAVPVETKRARVPDNEQRSHEPERIQLMAQGLLLREHGYQCDHGFLYYAGSRTRVLVPFTPDLEARTLDLIERTRQAVHNRDLPPPLDDSPKCKGCSLNGICLPDETLVLQQLHADHIHACPKDHSVTIASAAGIADVHAVTSSRESAATAPTLCSHPIRRLYPARDDAQPLYVQEQGAFVGKASTRLIVRKDGQELSTVPLKDISQLVLCGNIGISAQAVHLLCEAGIPIVHLSMGHWFYGVTHGITLRNAFDRAAQFAAAASPQRCLDFARQIITDKVSNQRTLLRRNAAASQSLSLALRDLDDLLPRIPAVASLESLLGVEGNAAAIYFARFADMIKPRDFDAMWDFTNRNRRPPRDPVNALLSFVYALLVKECTVAILAEGLDPWWGFYHQPRHGRPALALDLMEPLRPIVADSVVLTAINTGMVAAHDFERSAAGCMLKPNGRKAVLRAFEARLDQLITHPLFDYRCSWRAALRLQARLLSRWLRGDIPRFENIVTR